MNKIRLLCLLGLVAICRVSFGATDQPSSQQIRYQCSLVSSDKPIPHDFSKLTNRSGIDIITTPVFTGKIGQEVCFQIVKELFPEYVKNQKFRERIQRGISVFLEGTLDQDKIILIGKMTSAEVDAPKTSPEETSLETRSSALYFSTITESGKEVWFDAHHLLLKGSPLKDWNDDPSRYAALRIIPTIVPAKQ
jgi:hypothetical protein